MGLDVFFFSRKKSENTKENIKNTELTDILNNIENSEELKNLLNKLNILANKKNNSIQTILKEAITYYLNEEEYNYQTTQELAYFRKFWFLIDYFEYTDEYYAQDKPVTKEQLEDLKNKTEKAIKTVQTTLQHLNNYTPGDFNEFIKTPLNDHTQNIADKICEQIFNDNDVDMYKKTITLYNFCTQTLEDTDFENEIIVINANW